MSDGRAIVVDVRSARGFGRHAPLVRRVARAALRELGEAPCEISLALVDDDEMRALNGTWRGRDRTTDVLSFAQLEGEPAPDIAGRLLGDVVVSVPTAVRQAAARGRPAGDEIAELLVHGILHLLGWDHERSPADARRMFRRQREILASVAAAVAPPPAGRRSAGRRPARGAASLKPRAPAR